MFADSEIEKLRLSLQQCREGLQRNPEMSKWALAENQIEPAAGIGYTALAAVMNKPDPTRGKALPSSPSAATIPDSPPELPMVPQSPMSMDRYPSPSMSHRMDMPPPGMPEATMYDRERVTGPSFSRESSKYTSGGYSSAYSTRSSSMPLAADNLSEITAATSIAEIDDMFYQQDLNDRGPKQAVRIPVDPSKVPRWTPKQRGPVSPQSRTALLSAVQQQDHKSIEQLLDSGVPADGTPERNLLTVSIVGVGRHLPRPHTHPLHTDIVSSVLSMILRLSASYYSSEQILMRETKTETPHSFRRRKPASSRRRRFFCTANLTYQIELSMLTVHSKYGADANVSAGPHDESPFARAVNSGQTSFADLYLKHGAQPDLIMGNGNTAFIQAINKTVAVPMVELMLAYNINANHKNDRGETALFRAITAERLDVVRALLDSGANADLPGPKHMLWVR